MARSFPAQKRKFLYKLSKLFSMRIFRTISSTFAFTSLVFLFLFPQPTDLIKISKKGFTQWEILQSYQIEILQDLNTCFIARINRELLQVLNENQITYSILDEDIKDKHYFLVHYPSWKPLDRLKEKGNAIVLEKDTVLFWAEIKDPILLIPAEIPRKPLSSESILPYLQAPYSIPREIEYEIRENETVKRIVNEVSSNDLRYFIQSLQDFKTRYSSTPTCEEAGELIYNYFQNLGLDVSYQSFTFGPNYTSRNIIGELRGVTYPEDVLIVCGHYDSTSYIPEILAPGADDNASGTAAVLEAARILVNYPLDFTVRFIAFSAEEWGLYGSRAYASKVQDENESIVGIINLDMIGYADNMPEELEIIVNPASEWLAEKTIQSSRAYVPTSVRKTVDSSFVYSDHASFWEKGYYALCGIEDYPLVNPYYHSPYDTIDTLNFEFCTPSVKVVLAILSELAQPIRAGHPTTPVGLTGKYVVYSSLFSQVIDVYLTWNHNPDAVGYNVYRTTIPHLNYNKINSSPILGNSFLDRNASSEIRYFYVITAVGSSGLESNFSREIEIAPDNQSSLNLSNRMALFIHKWHGQ